MKSPDLSWDGDRDADIERKASALKVHLDMTSLLPEPDPPRRSQRDHQLDYQTHLRLQTGLKPDIWQFRQVLPPPALADSKKGAFEFSSNQARDGKLSMGHVHRDSY